MVIVLVDFGVNHHFGTQPQIGDTRLKDFNYIFPTFWNRGGDDNAFNINNNVVTNSIVDDNNLESKSANLG